MITASLLGCGGKSANSSATTTTTSAVTAAPNIDQQVVTTAGLAKVQADVAGSALPALDKNRFAAFIDDHQRQQNAYDGKTVREVINLQVGYEVALRMAAQARADDEKHKAEIAELVTSQVSLAAERDRSIVLHVDLRNLAPKVVKQLEIALEVDDAAGGKRIGLAEIHLVRTIPAKGRIAFDYPMRYVRFGEDAGTMIAAKGRPKKLLAQVTEIKYADGSDAGFDD